VTTSIRAALLAIAFASAPPAFAEIYKWTDSNGKVHFSDRAPPDAKAQKLKTDVQSFDAPPMIERPADVIRRPARNDSAARPQATQLTMYATSWCGYCRRARAYFAQKGISYREVDVEASEANQKEFRAYGGRGVPLFVRGDHRMRGFSAEAFERFLAASR
jgi:glutaredoxin